MFVVWRMISATVASSPARTEGIQNSHSFYSYSYSYYNAYSYDNGPAYGYDGSMVAQVERRLAELGYYDGIIDGIMRRQTRAAISAYESTHNLVVDGTINAQLLRRMGLA